MINILDMTDDQLAALLDEGMSLGALPPPLADIRDELLELALRLREIKQLCLSASRQADGVMYVQAERVLRLLDGTRRVRR